MISITYKTVRYAMAINLFLRLVHAGMSHSVKRRSITLYGRLLKTDNCGTTDPIKGTHSPAS